MIMINFTGLDHFRWLPWFERASSGDGVWYVTAEWFNVEATISSIKMATEMIGQLNGIAKTLKPETPQ